jgi:O-antigen/teichoic acid export membrane protein
MSSILGRHSSANLVGSTIPMIVALITIPIYLRFIGAERYGILAIIMILLGYSGFFDFGIGRAVTQRMARMNDASESARSDLLWTALTTSLILGAVGSVVLWFGIEYLVGSVVQMSSAHKKEALDAIDWLLIALPLLLPATALTGALHARFRFVEVNLIHILGGVLGQLLPLISAIFGFSELRYLVPITIAGRIFTVVLLFFQCCKYVPLFGRPVFYRAHLLPMISYGGWISVIVIVAPLLVMLDRLAIATLTGARSIANYTIPHDLVSKATIIPGSFYSALFPRMAVESEEAGRLLALRASIVLVAIMTPIVITSLFIVQPFLNLWVGDYFAGASYGVAEIVLIGVWLNAIVIPHHARFLSKENPRTIAIIYLLEIPVYCMILWIGILYWGIVGAALAWSSRMFLDVVILLRLNRALAKTIKAISASFFLIGIAGCGLLIFNDSIAKRVILMGILVTISLIKDRSVILNMYRNIFGKK